MIQLNKNKINQALTQDHESLHFQVPAEQAGIHKPFGRMPFYNDNVFQNKIGSLTIFVFLSHSSS